MAKVSFIKGVISAIAASGCLAIAAMYVKNRRRQGADSITDTSSKSVQTVLEIEEQSTQTLNPSVQEESTQVIVLTSEQSIQTLAPVANEQSTQTFSCASSEHSTQTLGCALSEQSTQTLSCTSSEQSTQTSCALSEHSTQTSVCALSDQSTQTYTCTSSDQCTQTSTLYSSSEQSIQTEPDSEMEDKVNKILELEQEVLELRLKHELAEKEKTNLKKELEKMEDKLQSKEHNDAMEEERKDMEAIVAALHKKCQDYEDRWSSMKTNHNNEIVSLRSKINQITKENSKLAQRLSMKKPQSRAVRKDEIEAELMVKKLQEENLVQKQELAQLNSIIDDLTEKEAKRLTEKDSVTKLRVQMESELKNFKSELESTKKSLAKEKKARKKMVVKDIVSFVDKLVEDDPIFEKQPQARANLIEVKHIKQAFQSTTKEKIELEEMADKYQNQIKRLSAKQAVSQQREKVQLEQLRTYRKLIIENMKSQLEIDTQVVQDKARLELKEREIAELQLSNQLTASKLARCKKNLDEEIQLRRDLKSLHHQSKEYIEKLVATVNEHNPDIMDKVGVYKDKYK